MEKVLSVSSIARIDEETVSQYGVPQSVLIENAASDFIKSLCLSKDSLIQIICGKGNNGADGFAIGRRLSNSGFSNVVCIQVFDVLGAECQRQKDMAVAFGVEVLGLEAFQKGKGIVIDALYGSGFHPPMDERGMSAIDAISGHPDVIAVDVPSGLSDQSPVNAPMAHCRFTVTFGALKPCLLGPFSSSSASDGPLPSVSNPGFPKKLMDSADDGIDLIDDSDCTLQEIDASAYKNTRGHAAFFSGCERQCGASILCGLAAFSARAGLVSILSKPGQPRFEGYPQLMSGLYCDDLSSFDAVGAGNGLDIADPASLELVDHVLKADRPTVLDSGAIRILSKIGPIPQHSRPLVLTPHMGELSDLLGIPDLKALSTALYIAALRKRAAELGAVIVAKSSVTWIACPSGRIHILWGKCSALGVAGSGDILCGIITAFLAQGMDAESAAVNGVLAHRLAGRLASDKVKWFDSVGLASYIGKAVDQLSRKRAL